MDWAPLEKQKCVLQLTMFFFLFSCHFLHVYMCVRVYVRVHVHFIVRQANFIFHRLLKCRVDCVEWEMAKKREKRKWLISTFVLFCHFQKNKQKFTWILDSFQCTTLTNTQLSYRQSEFVGQKVIRSDFLFLFFHNCCWCCCHSLYGKSYTHWFHLWKWMLTCDCSQLKFR